MIVSYWDKRTKDFAAGKRVKAFFGIERAARLKLDRLGCGRCAQRRCCIAGQSF
jgi:hypothetical protein